MDPAMQNQEQTREKENKPKRVKLNTDAVVHSRHMKPQTESMPKKTNEAKLKVQISSPKAFSLLSEKFKVDDLKQSNCTLIGKTKEEKFSIDVEVSII